MVKKAAAMANLKTARLDSKIAKALIAAADEIIDGKLHDNFIVDPIQGGAGTSINMNMNEVLCNRALEIIGEKKDAMILFLQIIMLIWLNLQMMHFLQL